MVVIQKIAIEIGFVYLKLSSRIDQSRLKSDRTTSILIKTTEFFYCEWNSAIKFWGIPLFTSEIIQLN